MQSPMSGNSATLFGTSHILGATIGLATSSSTLPSDVGASGSSSATSLSAAQINFLSGSHLSIYFYCAYLFMNPIKEYNLFTPHTFRANSLHRNNPHYT